MPICCGHNLPLSHLASGMNTSQSVALFPGTFDPITLGHQDLITRSAGLFGRVIVAVAAAYHKKTLFSLDERLALVREVFADKPKVQVVAFDGLLSEFACQSGAHVLVRGVRGMTDFEYELQLAAMNRAMRKELETVFLPPDARWQHVSSTLVREIARLGGPAHQFVDALVWQALQDKLKLRPQE